ncbi:hypothetical protein RRG08_055582 [Elysia crispata]|uniref:Uncharacterized protein n=1 Tax=Elysia crispata TaxID=231223 RepID=A0AAE1E7M3_9GAST|nr:hypothetical protein RRG08_055582 [Elysia crispata]
MGFISLVRTKGFSSLLSETSEKGVVESLLRMSGMDAKNRRHGADRQSGRDTYHLRQTRVLLSHREIGRESPIRGDLVV